MVDVVVLIARLHRELDAQTLEDLDIHLGEHHGSVSLTAGELGELFQSLEGCFVGSGCGGEGDEHLIRVKSRVVTAQILGLEKLNWFDGSGGDYMVMTVDAGELKEFKRTAERAPRRSEVFPRIIFPLSSSRAAAGPPVSSA